jgi:hypothetical protein
VLLYVNSQLPEIKNKKAIALRIVLKINLTKGMKDLYNKTINTDERS